MMLTPQGIVKLMDFGIARSSSDGSLTSTGTTLGSLNYMPPEQVRGQSSRCALRYLFLWHFSLRIAYGKTAVPWRFPIFIDDCASE